MNNISSILVDIAKKYFRESLDSGRECRLLIPGLTRELAIEIHKAIHESGISSFLIVSKDVAPSAQDGWMHADGITSKREGSLIVTCFPGELAYLQDSFSGSGGTVRSAAYSEEWPWIDSGTEAFSFKDEVLPRLASIWGNNDSEYSFIKSLIKEILNDTGGITGREHLVLEGLLGTFTPDAYPEPNTLQDKLFFHLGIPGPFPNDCNFDEIVRSIRKLVECISERIKEMESRRDIIEKVEEMFPELDANERSMIKAGLDDFFDGLGLDVGQRGLLALRNAWGAPKKLENWRCLTIDSLSRVFGFDGEGKKGAKFEAKLGIPLEQEKNKPAKELGVSNGKIAATFHGLSVPCEVNYNIPSLDPSETVKVNIYHGKRLLTSGLADGHIGSLQLQVNTSDITSHKKKLSLRVELDAKGVSLKKNLNLHLCGVERPFFVVVPNNMKVLNPSQGEVGEIDDDDAEKIVIEEPADIVAFSLEYNVAFSIYPQWESLPSKVKCPGMFVPNEVIDPCEYPSAEVTIIASIVDSFCSLTLEAKDEWKGEYTLQDELRTLVQKGRHGGRISELLSIYSGESRSRYHHLGDLNEKTRRRFALARYMEGGDYPWLPLLVDLTAFQGFEADRYECAWVSKGLDVPSALKIFKNEVVRNLVREYASARHALIELVKSFLDVDGTKVDRPLYAMYPTFSASSSIKLEQHLIAYLAEYNNVVSFIAGHGSSLEWGELFLLSYLDCAVDWGQSFKNRLFLVGPWHPLVVTKRYLVQKSLYAFANRNSRGKDEEAKAGFHRLSSLLKYVVGFRWFSAIDDDNASMVGAYCAPLSDDGWQFCFRHNAADVSIDDINHMLQGIEQSLGLDSNILPVSSENSAGGYVKDYLRAYPSRRSISARIESGYTDEMIIESINKVFESSFQNESNHWGAQLPGGVHLHFKEPVHCPRLDGSKAGRLRVYENPSDDVYERFPVDIALLPPLKRMSFSPVVQSEGLPRGMDDAVIFSAALNKVVQGREGTPSYLVSEIDREPFSGNALSTGFLSAVSNVAGLRGAIPSLNLLPDLPEKLKCHWNVLPGMLLDPAIFIKYLAAGVDSNQTRALWDFNVDLEGRVNTYFVLSSVPDSLISSLERNPVLSKSSGIASKLISQLGEVGIAIGCEAMRSTQKSLGVIGLVAAVKLFTDKCDYVDSPLRNSEPFAGFILPVDSFKAFLGDLDADSSKRADLLAVQLGVMENGRLMISACAVECKYSSNIFPQGCVEEALGQAEKTIENFKYLVDSGLLHAGIPERLALLTLVSFGLRTLSRPSNEWIAYEAKVLRALLSGNYEFVMPREGKVLVTTEAGLNVTQARFSDQFGYWVRLSPDCWPETAENDNLKYSRKMLSALFLDVFSRTASADQAPQPSQAKGGNIAIQSDDKKGSLGIDMGETNVESSDMLEKQGNVVASEELKASSNTVKAEQLSLFANQANLVVDLDQKQDVQSRDGIKFVVGSGLGFQRGELFFHPSNTDLNQLNIGIIGDLGTGKTQLIQSVIYNLVKSAVDNRGQAPRFLIFDYKKDYSDREKAGKFIDAVGAKIVNPFKIPLSLFDVGSNPTPIDKINKANFLIDVFKKIYGGVGHVQVMKLRHAIKECYEDAALTNSVPTMRQVYEKYYKAVDGDPDSPLSILDNICSLEIFEDDPSKLLSFHDFFKGVTVLNLGYLGSDDMTKNMIVVLFLNIYYDYMMNLEKRNYEGTDPQLRFIDSYLLVDEADNIMKYNFSVLKQILLQGREFGVGVLLASQYLSHFVTRENNYTEPLLTWFIHKVPNLTKSELTSIGLANINDEILAKIKNLNKHECFYKSYGVSGKFMAGIPFYKLIE